MIMAFKESQRQKQNGNSALDKIYKSCISDVDLNFSRELSGAIQVILEISQPVDYKRNAFKYIMKSTTFTFMLRTDKSIYLCNLYLFWICYFPHHLSNAEV